MNIQDLIRDIEQTRWKVISKEFVLSRLRQLEIHKEEKSRVIPISELTKKIEGFTSVK